jgi:hypothetical protein
MVQPEYESEISESVDISEEIRQLQGSSLFYHYEKKVLQELPVVNVGMLVGSKVEISS